MNDKPFARIAWHGRINFIDTKAVMLSDGESDIANILQWKDGDTAFDSGPDDAQRICDCINAAVSALVAAARQEEREAASAMIMAWADAEDRMAEECKRRGLSDAATTRFRVRNLLKNAADRVRTHQPAPDSGLYESESP